jgi:hypothetical protein
MKPVEKLDQLTAVAGVMVKDILAEYGKAGDAYIVICVRNTPEIDTGSDQVMVTNIADDEIVSKTLKWNAEQIDKRIATRAKAKRTYHYEAELERWVDEHGLCVHWGESDGDGLRYSFDLRPDAARFIVVTKDERDVVGQGLIEWRGDRGAVLFDKVISRDDVIRAGARMLGDFERIRLELKQ